MVGFPHSEILGSKLIRSSPRLIAAYYVLHRLHAPRHPLDALKALDRSHYQCPQPSRLTTLLSSGKLIGQIKLTRIHVRCCLSPGCGSNKQQSISLRCRKIRPPVSIGRNEKPNLLSVRRYVFAGGSWWSRTGSNRRPEACKATALPTELRPLWR
jgi:hypothetical protein